MIQHPEFCAFFKASIVPFVEHHPLLRKVGRTGCIKSQEWVSNMVVFGTPSLAAQSRNSAPRILRLSKSALLAYFWGPTLYRNGGYWVLKVPEKVSFGARKQAAQ